MIEKINTYDDFLSLTKEETSALCDEIRDTITDTVSHNGGHLSSNLGAVELTVALHRVFSPEVDRIVFDVGHQSYTHKILTGRYKYFDTLRKTGGLSGFTNPYESNADAFVSGHASNSVSVALGMAKARTLLGKDYDVVAVIGDGSLTGGLAYEGLTNASQSKEPLVIIINDNNMSIGKNVGGMAYTLQQLRINMDYLSFKSWLKENIFKTGTLYRIIHNSKEKIKGALLPNNIFTDLGFEYLGPIDGHDVNTMTNVFRHAKEMRKPVIVHVITKKGKGCAYAEENPDIYHGVGPFDKETGKVPDQKSNYSDMFGEYICEIANENRKTVAITAAMSSGTGLDTFKRRFPERFFDVGITEGHAVTFSAGLAKQGMIPVFAVYSSFLQRSFDMLIHDVSLLDLHVVLCVERAGIVGQDGMTHHGVFDVAFLSMIPNMTILAPASYAEFREMLRYAVYDVYGPVAVRIPKDSEGRYKECHVCEEQVLCSGDDITLVGYGSEINDLLSAADILKSKGVQAEVIKLGILKPNRFSETLSSLKRTGILLAAEEVCSSSCMGAIITEAAVKADVQIRDTILLNLGNGIVPHGDSNELRRKYRLDAVSIADEALKHIKNKNE
ncbi:MAG: 1-deoxy-D-xylulose-5-phosphate synthase [Oscillospiraceae bacterium]|nr:1-deoxy-D-xylulose-5-phosphate synthase [Oscillospiraceae bacterium]